MASNGSSKGGYGGFVGNALATGVAAAAVDGVSETLRVPILNQESSIPGMSWAEVVLYGAGTILTVLGGVSLISKRRAVLGIDSSLLPQGVGLIGGTYVWENTLSKLVPGLRA
jgi:hypothetical protein